MPKVAFFGHISPNFLTTFFLESPPNVLGTPQNFLPPKNFSASPNFFTVLDLEILFLDFLDLKNFFRLFRPKTPFLDFLDLKIFSNRLNSLQKHLLNLQSHKKNYIFNFSIYSKELPLL